MSKDLDDIGRPLTWGVLGAARIAAKALIPAIRAAGGSIRTIGASTRDRADAYAREHGIDRAVEGYQAVLDDPDVEAVYIPLANGLHLEWAIKAARAGKACLCEKPLVMTGDDAHELRAIFEANSVRLQEAFMWRHHPQIEWLREQIDSGVIGDLQRVNATFSFQLDRPKDYRWRADQGGGALWDIGCYCVNATRHFFGSEPLAASVRASMTTGDQAVDESAAGWLDYGNGRLATLSCSFRAGFAQGIELVGAEGRVWIGKPWLQVDQPTRVMIERDNERTLQEFEPVNAYQIMVKRFTRAARDPAFSLRPGEDGFEQAVAMEGALASAAAGGNIWTRDT